jgi:hypothetical protein
MKKPGLILLTLILVLLLPAGKIHVMGQITSDDKAVIRGINSSVDHNHCTTRQFQHKTFFHEGVWFVFYSDGADFCYQTSDDMGETWQPAREAIDQAPNGSSSFDVIKTGNKVYISHAFYPLGRYDVNAPYAIDTSRRGDYRSEGRIKEGRIEGREILWLANINPGFSIDYSNIEQDSDGYFWVFARKSQQGVVYRSRRPEGIEEWMPESICLPEKGRHAFNAVAMDEGTLYIVSMLTEDGKLYGNLYDGQTWGEEAVLIADDVTTVAGDDRRLSLEFDPILQRLHLIYVDAESILRYRFLDAPYQPENWKPGLSEAGLEFATNIFTCALSMDTTQSSYGLVVTYGLEKHAGKDKRERTGELYARRFDGQEWLGEKILMSQPGSIYNWYPNVNQDCGDGLCLMYSRSVDKSDLGKPLAVMVSVWLLNGD